MLRLLSLDFVITFTCLASSLFLYISRTRLQGTVDNSQWSKGYILINQVTHARLLPVTGTHSFAYPMLSLLLSLKALESHELDLGYGFVFGYNRLWSALTALRSTPYLSPHLHGRTIRDKLEVLLEKRGYLNEGHKVEDAWIMTMPSYFGFEGINSLTVYFVYRHGSDKVWLVLLEIHNTFGETHIHILQTGVDEDSHVPFGFPHQWTFRRDFHVSPFNDRSGFYRVSAKVPPHPPTFDSNRSSNQRYIPPKPCVRIHLHTEAETDSDSEIGPLKLTAQLRAVSSIPLCTRALLLALAQLPFGLFLSMARILYQAWILHYVKRLDIFIRPELKPSDRPALNSPRSEVISSEGVKWLPPSLLERYARHKVERFLRTRELGVSVTLIPADPTEPCSTFPTPAGGDISAAHNSLTISYISPRFFTTMFLCPSAAHALLLGSHTSKLFSVSSEELFSFVFCSRTDDNDSSSNPVSVERLSRLQRLRLSPVPPLLFTSSARVLHIPSNHPLDNPNGGIFDNLIPYLVTHLLLFRPKVEKWVYQLAKARIVIGDEPWLEWERAAQLFEAGLEGRQEVRQKWADERGVRFGSVWRDM